MDKNTYFDSNFDFSDRKAITEALKRFSSAEDGRSVLSLCDFIVLIQNILTDSQGKLNHVSDEVVSDMFTHFDSNGDGKIDAKEYEMFLNSFVKPLIRPVTALLVIDMQNDFIDGSFALKHSPAKQDGNNIIPVINKLIQSFEFDVIAYTLDCHPSNHISFYENLKYHKLSKNNKSPEDISLFDTVLFEGNPEIEQKLWPVHCVQNTWGCELHKDLIVKKDSLIIHKGQKSDVDSYSAFYDNMSVSCTALHEELKKRDVTHVFICGVALDYCVAFTALDALKLGYATVIIEDGTAGTDDENIKIMKDKLLSQHCVFSVLDEIECLMLGKDRRTDFASIFMKKLKAL